VIAGGQAITIEDMGVRGQLGALRRVFPQWQAYLPSFTYGTLPQPEQPHRDAIVTTKPVYGQILSQKPALT
jgi:hypothetical protein